VTGDVSQWFSRVPDWSEVTSLVNEDIRTGQLAFSASLGRNQSPWTLILLDLETATHRLLDDYSNGNDAVAPIWSPDGRQLLYSMNKNCAGVYIYDFDEGRRDRIDQPTAGGVGGCQAVWSPDGMSIVYMSAHSPKRECRTFRIRPDGSEDSPFPTLDDPGLRVRGFT
jgi:Tol biopolymer transport system component